MIVSSLGFSLTGFSLGSSVKGSSLGSQWFFRVCSNRFCSWNINAIFPPCRYFFLSNRAIIFFIKNMFYFTFVLFSKTISLTCFNNFNKTDSEKMNEEIRCCHPVSVFGTRHSLSFIVTHYSLSFVVPLVIRCHSYHSSVFL